MNLESPLVNVGSVLTIKWPMDDGSTEDVIGTIQTIAPMKSEKHGSKYLYSILVQSSFSNDLRRTRLANLDWKYSSVSDDHIQRQDRKRLPNYQYILAPMVGGSELAFRLLCRRYGATLAYTPMINSERFAVDSLYREEIFQTTPEDRPVVAHFGGNNPDVMLAAAKHVEMNCDAIGT